MQGPTTTITAGKQKPAPLCRVIVSTASTPSSIERFLARCRFQTVIFLAPSSLLACALSPPDLKTLNGIQCLPGLVSLQLSGVSFTDLSPLSGLSSLDELAFYSSATPDIATLGPAAEGLLTLHLINTRFQALAELAPLQALESLELRDSDVSSLEALPELRALRQLVLDSNALTELRGIERLPMLEDLSVNRNLLQSLADLNDHPKLRFVKAAENELTTLSDLKLPSATSLSVGANSIATRQAARPSSIRGSQRLRRRLDRLRVYRRLRQAHDSVGRLRGRDS